MTTSGNRPNEVVAEAFNIIQDIETESFDLWLASVRLGEPLPTPGDFESEEDDLATTWLSKHKTCMMHNNYHILIRRYMSKFKSYKNNDDYRWYYFVFKPFTKTKVQDLNWYMTKGIDYCRCKISKYALVFLCTLEYESESPHINIIVYGNSKYLDTFMGTMKSGTPKHCNKYAYYCAPADFSERLLKYILKEAKTRFFYKFKDYLEKV